MAEMMAGSKWPLQPPIPYRLRAREENWGRAEITQMWQALVAQYWTGYALQTHRVMALAGLGTVPPVSTIENFARTQAFSQLVQAIRARDEAHPAVASATELEVWWTEQVRDEERARVDPKTSLRASELLAKSKGMLKEKTQLEGSLTFSLAAANAIIRQRQERQEGEDDE